MKTKLMWLATVTLLAALMISGTAFAEGEVPPEASVVAVRDAAGNVRGELVVLELSLRTEKGVRRLQHLQGTLLLPDSAGH